MFGRAIWDKLPESSFENLKLSESVFRNHEGDLSQKEPETKM